MLRDGAHGSAVGQRLGDGDVEPVRTGLHLRPVERAAAVRGARPAAARALEGIPVRPLLEQEQLDASLRRRLEYVLPAGGRAAAPARLLAPALERSGLLARAPALEDRQRELEQL